MTITLEKKEEDEETKELLSVSKLKVLDPACFHPFLSAFYYFYYHDL
jgi:hypothetical protein